MKLKYTTGNGRISAEFDADSQREFFSQISSFQEVFEEANCGKCDSDNLRFVVRTVDENEYHELHCKKCRAKLAFGANKKGGGLFPKRKDSDGTYLPDNGWTRWNSTTGKNE